MMFRHIFFLLMVVKPFFFIPHVNSQVLSSTPCPAMVQPMRGFTPEKFLGTWYELERFYSDFQVNSKCNKVELERRGGRIGVMLGGIHERTGLPHRLSHGLANFDYTSPSRLTLTLIRSLEEKEKVFDYSILDTDYESYAIIYNCEDLCGGRSAMSLWILGRTALLPKESIHKIHERVKRFGLDAKKLLRVDQHACPNLSVSVRSEKVNLMDGGNSGGFGGFDRTSAKAWLTNLLRRKYYKGSNRKGRVMMDD